MSRIRGPVWVVIALLGGCALSTPPFELPAPADEEALAARTRADPHDVDATLRIAGLRLAGGDPAGARDALNGLDGMAADDDAVLFARGVVELEAGRDAEAGAHFLEYARRWPTSATGLRAARRAAALQPAMISAAAERALAALDGPAGAPSATDAVLVIPWLRGPDAVDPDGLAVGSTELVADRLSRLGLPVVDPDVAFGLARAARRSDPAASPMALSVRAAAAGGAGAAVHVSVAVTIVDGSATYRSEALVARLTGDRTVVTPITALEPTGDLPGQVNRLVAQVATELGHRWTPSDAERMAPRPLSDATAIGTLGLGIAMAAEGGPSEAFVVFDAVAEAAPGLPRARRLADLAMAATEADEHAPLEDYVAAARAGERQRAVASLMARSVPLLPAPSGPAWERWVVPEVMGLDRLGLGAIVELAFAPAGGA